MEKTKKILSALIYFTILSLTISSCKKQNNNPSSASTSSTLIVPLKIGNQWNLRSINYVQHIDTSYYSNVVVDDTTIANIKWYIQISNGTDRVPWLNMSDGLHYYNTHMHQSYLSYKYPAQVNDSYYDSYYHDSLKVLSINFNVTVPAGAFYCYKYLDRGPLGPSDSTIIYVSPGFGFIKAEQYFNGINTTLVELISYHLN